MIPPLKSFIPLQRDDSSSRTSLVHCLETQQNLRSSIPSLHDRSRIRASTRSASANATKSLLANDQDQGSLLVMSFAVTAEYLKNSA